MQNYGRVRAVGSLAFILTATLGGLLLGRFGQQLVPALVGLTMLLTALACLFLRRRSLRRPDSPLPGARRRPDLRGILRQRPLLLAIAAAGMIQLSHSLYFTTASLGWQTLGYSSFSVGAFWGLAVIARSASSPSPTASWTATRRSRVMLFSSLCAALRWGLLAGSEHLAAILLGQCLHALSFAAYHAAVMRYIRDHAPESARYDPGDLLLSGGSAAHGPRQSGRRLAVRRPAAVVLSDHGAVRPRRRGPGLALPCRVPEMHRLAFSAVLLWTWTAS
ncbi:MFS transporter [Pseudomonas aeruginosa]|nr:MFS transporter [Pseudomonas aeruginosa]